MRLHIQRYLTCNSFCLLTYSSNFIKQTENVTKVTKIQSSEEVLKEKIRLMNITQFTRYMYFEEMH